MFLADGVESLENIHDALDDLWKQTEYEEYPQNRMEHLFIVIGKMIGANFG